VGVEPTIPVFEWVKTFHASDLAATVIDARKREIMTKMEARREAQKRKREAIEAKWRVRRLEMEGNR
jgi:hypothetical protein